MGVRRHVVVKQTLRREAMKFLNFLLGIQVHNRGKWAAQRRSQRHYARTRMGTPLLVGGNKGAEGMQNFAAIKAQFDTIRGQTNFDAEIHYPHVDWKPIIGENTKPRQRPTVSKDINMMIVGLSAMVWPNAKHELAGALLDHCETKELPLPFGLPAAQEDYPFGKIEARLKRRLWEVRRNLRASAAERITLSRARPPRPEVTSESKQIFQFLFQGGPQMSRWEVTVRNWYHMFKVFELQKDLRQRSRKPGFCCPSCGTPIDSGRLKVGDKDEPLVWHCGDCGSAIVPVEEWVLRAMNFTYSPQDEAFIQALSRVST